jgi:type II secretory pathway predicted ATPase ExeA
MTAATDSSHFYIANIMYDFNLAQTALAKFIEDEVGFKINASSLNKYLLRRRSIIKYDDNKAIITCAINKFLAANDIPQTLISKIWDDGEPRGFAEASKDAMRMRVLRELKKSQQEKQKPELTQPEPEMLTQKARMHFKVSKDPFVNEINSADDLFLHDAQRFAREQMLHSISSGTMMALIGESGAGKTQVRRSFYHIVGRDEEKMIIIEPQTIDKKDMTPSLILAAIVDELGIEGVPQNREKAARYIQKHLRAMSEQGYKFALVFEEAHDLPERVLKFLKRMWEWENGFSKLLSMILIGQNELKENLSSIKLNVREFSRRCHQVELPPLADSMPEYLSHKLERAGQSIGNVITPEGVKHLGLLLRDQQSYSNHRHGHSIDNSTPLTVNSWISASMNHCAKIGEPLITPEVIDQIKRSL